MDFKSLRKPLTAAILAIAATTASSQVSRNPLLPNLHAFSDPTGLVATYSTTGMVPLDGPFFQSLGSNGRSCGTCHQASQAWTVTPAGIRARFEASEGLDPIFRANDGANSPLADVSTVEARRQAYSMLLGKGVIRVGLPVPANAEFDLIAVDDPYGFASASELSLFRRPLPTTNLKFLSAVMWDGRETFKDAASSECIRGTTNCFASIHFDLSDQSNAATVGHAQAANPLTAEQRAAIVDFESTLFTAQIFDDAAGNLDALHAGGGPEQLARTPYHFGINDVVSGDYQTGADFDPVAFRLYEAWAFHPKDRSYDRGRNAYRAAVARGEQIFNMRPITITGVKGLNDDLGIASLAGTCTTCHDTPGAGNHSIPVPLDIGLTDASRRTPDMPLYTLRRYQAPFDVIQTTDPGRALITGKWQDIGRFKGPVLRALAARAPYFHNGFANDLDAVADFYNERFDLKLTDDEHDDLVAFLLSL